MSSHGGLLRYARNDKRLIARPNATLPFEMQAAKETASFKRVSGEQKFRKHRY